MNKKKLIITTLIGVVGLLSLSVSFTYAWYASSTRLHVDEVITEFKTERNLKISTSPELDSFKEKINSDDDGVNNCAEFKPTSTMFSSLWMEQKEDKPIFRDSSSIMINSSGEPFLTNMDDGFYSQELYLLADDDVYVTISQTKSSFNADHKANLENANLIRKQFPDKTPLEIANEMDKLVDCLRVSVLIPDEENYSYTIIDPNKSGNTLMGGTLDNLNDGYFDYYKAEDGQNYEIIYGETINKNKAIFDEALSEDTSITGERSAFNAKTRKNVHKFNYEKSKQNGFDFKEEGAYSLSDIDNGESSMLKIPCYRNQPRKIVLSIYLEGWDLDCINSTMAASFTSDISFKIIREFVE